MTVYIHCINISLVTFCVAEFSITDPPVAQSVEQQPFKLTVEGSSPSGGTEEEKASFDAFSCAEENYPAVPTRTIVASPFALVLILKKFSVFSRAKNNSRMYGSLTVAPRLSTNNVSGVIM